MKSKLTIEIDKVTECWIKKANIITEEMDKLVPKIIDDNQAGKNWKNLYEKQQEILVLIGMTVAKKVKDLPF